MNRFLIIFANILDLAFPRHCISCGAPRTLLCTKCLAKIPSSPPSEHSFIHAVFDYRHPSIKSAIWHFKYKNARGFSKVFAEKLHEDIIGELGESLYISPGETLLLVPIPLHKKRLHERGYNQSDLLTKEVIKHDKSNTFEYAPDLLIRTRVTAPQARSQKRSARLANLRDAFTCPDPARIHGRVVILIDDVSTTGATLWEARR
ncbi:MAG: hypothetical protein A2481_01310, partial [Candidatus Yonathbacteria bacterium RIFOXYC2_FULL_47_9]